MFKTLFISELKSSLKRPMVYIFTFVLTAIIFGITATDVSIGGGVGNVYKNSPYTITSLTLAMVLFGILGATAFFNKAALKDYDNMFNEIIFSTQVSKRGYFFGRFFAALILSSIPFLGVFIGISLGSIYGPLFGWTSEDQYGDFHFMAYVNSFLLFVLPNMFIVGSIIFALAMKWKKTSISFIGVLAIIVIYFVTQTLTSDLDNETIAALLDTFGNKAYDNYTKYFTAVERNTINPSLVGIILYNRLIWVSVGIIILLSSYFSFSFKQVSKKTKSKKEELITNKEFLLPSVNSSFNFNGTFLQFKSFFKINFNNIFKSTTFRVLVVFSFVLLISTLVGGFEYYGLKSYPVTYKMMNAITGSVIIFIIIILVFYSGELVWRDRDNKINEVIDSTAHNSLISLLAKTISLIALASIVYIFATVIGIVYQLGFAYFRIELGVYLFNFMLDTLPRFIIMSSFMIFIQVISSNKYLGYFISIILIFGTNIIKAILHINTRMLSLGSIPSISYSDLNSFGPGVYGAVWFNIYWMLFALLTLILAGAMWNRGVATPLFAKIKNAWKSSTKQYKTVFYTVLVLWMITGSFVYYNTQVLNPYDNSDTVENGQVEYEQKYKKHEKAVLPKIIDIKYFIDIFPEERNVSVKAKLTLKNESNTKIDSLFFNTSDKWVAKFDIPDSKVVLDDEDLGFKIFKFNNALKPGDTLSIKLNTEYKTKGFPNGTGSTNVIKNGTFIRNSQILPSFGYNSSVELSDRHKRKEHGLPTKERMPKLDSTNTKALMANYLTNGVSDYINAETVISTSSDQIAIAPGSLIKQWKEGDRNYYKYKVDHKSQNFYSFISGRYEIATRKWNDVDIEVYYDKKHSANIEMMMDAVGRSLEYYTKNFGTYYHKQCRIIEFPKYSTFAQAFPGTMPYSESFGFIIDLEDEKENNIIDAVIAHEMSHQWWAHQVIGANMQGSTMMSESFAEYSSLMTLKSTTENPMKMREFLKYNHDQYLRGRGSETKKELPLYKVENQQYIHYKKGSVVLYALQDYIGEDKVNLAMKEFLDEYKYKLPPYPTSLDFLKHLEPKVPDSLKYLINDWFKEITLYDNRLVEAKYTKLENGKYKVTIDVESFKVKADSLGNQTDVATNDWIDIGAFADKDEDKLIYQKRVKIDKPKMTFSFDLDTIPAKVAIDPRHLLIDRVYKDNIKVVEEK